MSSLSLQNHLVGSQSALTAMPTNPKGFKAAIQSLCDFLVAHQVSATLWLKLPKDDAWWTDVWQYGQQAVGCTLYSLGTQTGNPPENMAASLRPIPIEQDTDLKREYLCMAVADSFVVSLLAVRNPNATDKRTLQLYCTVSGQAIAALSTGIKAVLENSQSQTDSPSAEASAGSETASSDAIENRDRQTAAQEYRNNDEAIAGQAALSQWARLFPSSVLRSPTHPLDNAFLTWQLQAQETLRSELSDQNKSDSDALDALSPNFLSQANQELQAPLTTIKTALTLLGSPTIKLSQRQLYLEMIATQCDRQKTLIASVFDLLRIQTTPAATTEPLKLSDIIPGIVSTYQPLAEERGVMLAHTIPPNLPEAMGIESALKEALIHLIENGVAITSKGGRVWVTAALFNSATVSIKVQDSGRGLSKSDTARLFEAFYRSGEGAGLGLTLSKQLIEKMGGSIEVESQADRGTTFKILLPINQSAAPAQARGGQTVANQPAVSQTAADPNSTDPNSTDPNAAATHQPEASQPATMGNPIPANKAGALA